MTNTQTIQMLAKALEEIEELFWDHAFNECYCPQCEARKIAKDALEKYHKEPAA